MQSTNSTQTDYDIIIVGAGMSGCLLAYAILKLSPEFTVLLLDDNAEQLNQGEHPGFDGRCIALSAGSCDLLDQLGVWATLKQQAQPIDDIHISDRFHSGMLDLHKKEKAFGSVVELHNVGVIINEYLEKQNKLARVYETTLTGVEKHIDKINCTLKTGEVISAKLCVAADGGNSLTRELFSIPSEVSDYGSSAIIANLHCSSHHNNKAYERFTDAGPIALLPLTDNRYALVWSVADRDLTRLMRLNDVDFLRELQLAFGFRAGIFESVGKRDSYPLKLTTTIKPVTHRGVAIGNAAHSLHPVMGQGFNLGLRDLFSLAKTISEITDKNELGDYAMLKQYWLARKEDHNRTIKMTDSIVRIFSNNYFPFAVSRNIGLRLMSFLPHLADPIVKQAEGRFNLFKRDKEL